MAKARKRLKANKSIVSRGMDERSMKKMAGEMMMRRGGKIPQMKRGMQK